MSGTPDSRQPIPSMFQNGGINAELARQFTERTGLGPEEAGIKMRVRLPDGTEVEGRLEDALNGVGGCPVRRDVESIKATKGTAGVIKYFELFNLQQELADSDVRITFSPDTLRRAAVESPSSSQTEGKKNNYPRGYL